MINIEVLSPELSIVRRKTKEIIGRKILTEYIEPSAGIRWIHFCITEINFKDYCY